MWLCDDVDEQEIELESSSIDLGEGEKLPGYIFYFMYFIIFYFIFSYYIRRSGGLFPAYLPQSGPDTIKILELFKVFGIFLAKAIQDSRLVDIPLSSTFLKLIISPKVCF